MLCNALPYIHPGDSWFGVGDWDDQADDVDDSLVVVVFVFTSRGLGKLSGIWWKGSSDMLIKECWLSSETKK